MEQMEDVLKSIAKPIISLLTLLVLLLLFTGCQKTYYAFWEKLGKEKRHLLKDNVEDAKDAQEEASEEFKEVLTRIKEIYGFEGGELEEFYVQLKSDYEGAQNRAQAVRARIKEAEAIAGDLFAEWEAEIERMDNAKFRANSRESLRETRRRFQNLHKTMTKAQAKMTPVLDELEDYVLYLKHNLNARAIGVLRQEAAGIEIEVQSLIDDIRSSVQEADEFLKSME